MNFKYYILVPQDNEQSVHMYRDLEQYNNAYMIDDKMECHNSVIKMAYVFFKKWINLGFFGSTFLRQILQQYEPIWGINGNKEDEIVLFINDQRLTRYYFEIIKDLRAKNNNIKLVVHWLNAVDTVNGELLMERVVQLNPDIIMTDDPRDAERYGWIFWMDCMSSIRSLNKEESKSDVFFVGVAKDRERQIVDAYNILTCAGVRCDFTVVNGKKKIGSISKSWINYNMILEKDCNTNCILEIMQKGQTGYTCRAQEAIVLNKKLLTNNKWIVNSKYYNPRYIKVFERIGKGEIDFAKTRVEVNYGYNGEFSPCCLIDYLDKKLQE